MRRKLILCVVFMLLLSLTAAALTGCKPKASKSGPEKPKVSFTAAADALEAAAGTEISLKGVVFGRKDGGYFVSDGEGVILVNTAEELKDGDEIEVRGKISVKDRAPALEAETVKVIAGGRETPVPEAALLSDITGMTLSQKNFYKYRAIQGFLKKTDGVLTLEYGSAKFKIDANGKDADFASLIGMKIVGNFINTGFEGGWVCTYVGGAALYAVDLDVVKDAVFADVESRLAKTAYIEMSLPADYPDEPDVSFTWSVPAEAAPVAVSGNEATITPVESDTAVSLRLKLAAGDKTAEKDFEVKILAAARKNPADFAGLEAGAVVMTDARVYAKGWQHEDKRFTLLTGDEPDADNGNHVNYVAVDIDKALFEDFKPGDLVRVVGKKGSTMETDSLIAEEIVLLDGSEHPIDYASLEATELSDEGSYRGLVAEYLANTNRLYKIVTPYMASSHATDFASSNFIRFGYDALEAMMIYSDAEEHADEWRYFVFTRRVLDRTDPGLHAEINAYNSSNVGVRFPQYTLYAYAMFKSNQTWQFVIPDDSAVERDKKYMVEHAIRESVGTNDIIVASEAGRIGFTMPDTLPYADGGITWSQDVEFFNLETGEYPKAAENMNVVLTASYKVDGEDQAISFTFRVLTAEPEYISVTEALALEGENITAMRGTVVSFMPNTNSSGIPGGPQAGVIVSDGKSFMFIDSSKCFEKTSAEDDFDKRYALDGKVIEIGDTLKFIGAKKAGKSLDISNAKVTIGEPETLVWEFPADVPVARTQEELAAVTKNMEKYSLIRLEAAADAPLYLGGSSTTYAKVNIKFYFDVEKADADHTKVNKRWVVFKGRPSELVLGDSWWAALTDPGNGGKGFSTNAPEYPVKGHVYLLFVNNVSPYYHFAPIAPGFALEKLTDEEKAANEARLAAEAAEKEIRALVPADPVLTGDLGTAGDTMGLPVSTEHAAGIVWTAEEGKGVEIAAVKDEGGVVTGYTLTYNKVAEPTEVSLTAKYMVGEVEKETVVILTLSEQLPPRTWTMEEVFADLGENEEKTKTYYAMEAFVAAIGASADKAPTTPGAYPKEGLILTDGIRTLWYQTEVYEYNGAEIRKGDKVRITSPVVTVKEYNQSAKGGTIEVLSSGNAIDYTDLELAAEISSEDELLAYTAGIGVPHGVVVKFTGDFWMIGSNKKPEDAQSCRLSLHYKGAEIKKSADAQYEFGAASKDKKKSIAFHMQGNNVNVNEWYQNLSSQFVNPEITATSGISIPCTGTIYAVATQSGKTFSGWTILDYGFDLSLRETAAPAE